MTGAAQGMRILFVDDEPEIMTSVVDYLRGLGHAVDLASGGEEGMKMLAAGAFDIVISDLKMPRMDGFEVLRQTRAVAPGTEVIMVTGHGDLDSAVQAMREGAFDFFTKPVQLRELTASLERTVRFHQLRREKEAYKERLDLIDEERRRGAGLDAIVGRSAAIAEVKELIVQVSQTAATTVLILGETGSGKELVARAIHYSSARAAGPMVAVNCTAIPDALVESEFYGHVKGAFTDAKQARKGRFEMADGGTIFLDEIGDMGMDTQARLLRTLEERSIMPVGGAQEVAVDVRVVAATNRDLVAAIADKAFREDLYYRLNAFVIRIPPLRQRREDIPLIAQRFLQQFAADMRKDIGGFAAAAAARLEDYPFPGNIRELKNIVERAAILCKGAEVGADDLQFDPSRPEVDKGPQSLDLAENEQRLIRTALDQARGNQVQAARLLGIGRDALRRRMERYDLQ